MGAELMIALLPAIIKGGTEVASSVIGNRAASSAARTQADASREAARMQQEAADKAIAAQREQEGYNRQRQAAMDASRAPYVNASNQSLAALSRELNLPGFDAKAVPPMIQPTGDFQPADLSGYQTRGAIGTQPPPYQLQPVRGGMSLADFASSPEVQGGDTVMLEAPTGERQAVPRSMVAHYLSRGARRV